MCISRDFLYTGSKKFWQSISWLPIVPMLFKSYLFNNFTALCLPTSFTHFLPLKTVANWQQLHCTRQQNLLWNRLFGMCVFNQEKNVDIVIKNFQKGALKVSLIQLRALFLSVELWSSVFHQHFVEQSKSGSMSQVSWKFEKKYHFTGTAECS